MNIYKKIDWWASKNPHETALTNTKLCKDLHYELSKVQSENCPFCKKCPCTHWDGLGWTNPKYNKPVEQTAEKTPQLT